jgi:excisionase family DNA binding protein
VKRSDTLALYLTTKAAADYLDCSTNYLAAARVRGAGPRYVKVGKLVRYRRTELDRWMVLHEHRPHESSKIR